MVHTIVDIANILPSSSALVRVGNTVVWDIGLGQGIDRLACKAHKET